LAYVEVLAEEQQPTVIGSLSRAFSWLNGDWIEWRRVISAIWPAYVSKVFAEACCIKAP